MFTGTSSYTRFMRIFALSAFLAAFSLSLTPTATASPGLFDSSLTTASDVDTPETSLSQDLDGITDIASEASHIEVPKVDKWVSRPLKQFNPHEVTEGTKMIKKLGRPYGDKAEYPASKPSIRWAKAI